MGIITQLSIVTCWMYAQRLSLNLGHGASMCPCISLPGSPAWKIPVIFATNCFLLSIGSGACLPYFSYLNPSLCRLVLAASSLHCAVSQYGTWQMVLVLFSQDEYCGQFCPSMVIYIITAEATSLINYTWASCFTHTDVSALHQYNGHSTMWIASCWPWLRGPLFNSWLCSPFMYCVGWMGAALLDRCL